MTDLDVYQPANGIGQYQAGIVMTPEQAKALDEQVRACTRAVLREGVDYGTTPGTSDDRKTLKKPGAEKLLQWFGLAYTMHCLDVERDDEGRKEGATYRCTVIKRLGDGTTAEVATCEGYAGYEESKFAQSDEDAQAKMKANERKWAKQDGRPAEPTRWQDIKGYRAPWNTIIKMSQKRALVGAAIVATAAGGLFSQEEDQGPVADDASTWYEQAIEAALKFTDKGVGRQLYTDAAQAHRDGLITRRQQDHIQNTVTQRAKLLKNATVVNADELARTAAAGDGTRSQPRAGRQYGGEPTRNADEHGADPAPEAAGRAPSRNAQPLPPLPGESTEAAEDQPGSASKDQLTRLHTILTGLGFNGEDREQKLVVAEVITRHAPLTGPKDGRSSANLSYTEARKLIDTLSGFADRDALIAFMAEREQAGDGDD